jgi:hypothetical protein
MPEKNVKAFKWVKTGLIVYFIIVIKFLLIASIILAVDLARAGSAPDQNMSTILVIRLARLGSHENLTPEQKRKAGIKYFLQYFFNKFLILLNSVSEFLFFNTIV